MIKVEVALALSVIFTTRKLLAMSREQYHMALSMSCNSLLIRGIGYTINIVSGIQPPAIKVRPYVFSVFLMVTTIGDAHGAVDGRMILSTVIL